MKKQLQIPDAATENNLPPIQDGNDSHDDGAATPLNLHSPPRDSSELITISDASQVYTRM